MRENTTVGLATTKGGKRTVSGTRFTRRVTCQAFGNVRPKERVSP